MAVATVSTASPPVQETAAEATSQLNEEDNGVALMTEVEPHKATKKSSGKTKKQQKQVGAKAPSKTIRKKKAVKTTKTVNAAVTTEMNAVVTTMVAPSVTNKPTEVAEKNVVDKEAPVKECGCIGTQNHDPFNMKSEFIPGYSDTILRGIACGGNCGLKQVLPSTSKPVWLCPELNSGKGSLCRYALCSDCYGIANISSASSSRRRTKKTW